MNIKVTIPDHLRELTLEQYQRFAKVSEVKDQDEMFLTQKMVEIFCDIKLSTVLKISIDSIQHISEVITKAFSADHRLINTFWMGDVEYGFIPVLDDMTLGEYIDLDKNFSDWQSMHKTMSILFRPITYKRGDRYQIEEYKGTDNADLYKQMPLDIVFGAYVFFYNLENELLQITLNYLKKEAKHELTLVQRQILEANGDGISQYMPFLKGMSPNLNRSQN